MPKEFMRSAPGHMLEPGGRNWQLFLRKNPKNENNS
jgi:hypothetical protein